MQYKLLLYNLRLDTINIFIGKEVKLKVKNNIIVNADNFLNEETLEEVTRILSYENSHTKDEKVS
jgi:antitoxin component of MazEF toxin-antitoxin module